MKEYNVKILVDNDNFDIIYECDKDNNVECNKKNCGICHHTLNSKYKLAVSWGIDSRYIKERQRVEGLKNKPINDIELVEFLSEEIENYRNQIGELRQTISYLIENKK